MLFPASFFFLFALLTVDRTYNHYKSLSMSGFKSRTFVARSDHSANWATITALCTCCRVLHYHLLPPSIPVCCVLWSVWSKFHWSACWLNYRDCMMSLLRGGMRGELIRFIKRDLVTFTANRLVRDSVNRNSCETRIICKWLSIVHLLSRSFILNCNFFGSLAVQHTSHFTRRLECLPCLQYLALLN